MFLTHESNNRLEIEMDDRKEPAVWGVFVGERGDHLEAFNSSNGPFPPTPGSDGYIAIGWAGVGDMNMYRNNYPDFVEKFRVLYPNDDERTFKTQANMPWYFAFEMQEGDWVLSPSSTSGYLLAGRLVGKYKYEVTHDWSSVAKLKTRSDLLHIRKVQWLYAIQEDDVRYEKLHRIGQLTVVRPNISVPALRIILDQQMTEQEE